VDGSNPGKNLELDSVTKAALAETSKPSPKELNKTNVDVKLARLVSLHTIPMKRWTNHLYNGNESRRLTRWKECNMFS
jgi:hypothetical protein